MTNPSPASSASSLPAFDSPPPTPSPVPTQSSSGPARTTTATTTTGKLHQQPTDTVYLKQELKQYVERKRGTLRIDVHGLRNLKPPTPENLCRVYPRQSPLPPVNDFILVATLGDKRWESPPCFPPNQVAVMLKKSFEFSDVPYPPPGPGLEFSVQYRDVNGRTVVQWQTQPVSGEEWSLATPSHHTSMPLLTPHRYYIGDVLAKACFTFNKPDRLPYKKCWKRFGNTVSFPPSLLPSFLRDRIDAFLGWFLDGLLFLSQAFPTFSSALPTFVTPSFLRLSWEGKALFFVAGFAVCASVSIIFACLFSLALFFAPVTAFLFTTSLLASVGLGAPAVMLMGFLFTFPSVDEKVFQPSVEWAVTRLPLVGRMLLDDAGERKRGADR